MAKSKMKIGEGFKDFLLVPLTCMIYLFVGGYGSGKSVAVAYKLIMECLTSKTKVMVLRKSFSSHKFTTFSLISRLVTEMCPDKLAKSLNVSTSSIKFRNGSEFIFLGLQDPEKLKSLEGIDIAWIEEASEIEKGDFTEILGRLRGARIHVILSSNPLTKMNWLYNYFFIRRNPDGSETVILRPEEFYEQKGLIIGDVYYHHSTVEDNPFVSQQYVNTLKGYEFTDPFKYQVAYKGHFGVLGERVFSNWKIFDDLNEIPDKAVNRNGMDFGYVTSFDAVLKMKKYCNILWITKEMLKKGQDNIPKITKDISETVDNSATVYADGQEARLIEMIAIEGRKLGLAITKCRKGKESVKSGYRKLKSYEIRVHRSCVHTIDTLESLAHKEVNGLIIEDEFNFDPHLIDAMRYGVSYDVTLDTDKGDYMNGFNYTTQSDF